MMWGPGVPATGTRRSRYGVIPAVTLSVILLAGCGSSPSGGGTLPPPAPPPPPAGGSWIEATVDGEQMRWIPYYTRSGSGPDGQFNVLAEDAHGNDLDLSVVAIPGPGTYPLGMLGLEMTGGTVSFGGADNGWSTPHTGTAGSITFTTLSGNRAVGTFAFTAERSENDPRPPVQVTGGRFDITLSESFKPLAPAGTQRFLRATINGSPRYMIAGSAYCGSIANETCFISVGDAEYSILIMTIPNPPRLGTFPVNSGSSSSRFQISKFAGPILWGYDPQGSGFVTVTSYTDGIITGTFEADFPSPLFSTDVPPLVVRNGAFQLRMWVPQ